MNSHTHNFVTDGMTAQPTMLIKSTFAAGNVPSWGCASLERESLT
jgi:hypothetical protein